RRYDVPSPFENPIYVVFGVLTFRESGDVSGRSILISLEHNEPSVALGRLDRRYFNVPFPFENPFNVFFGVLAVKEFGDVSGRAILNNHVHKVRVGRTIAGRTRQRLWRLRLDWRSDLRFL